MLRGAANATVGKDDDSGVGTVLKSSTALMDGGISDAIDVIIDD